MAGVVAEHWGTGAGTAEEVCVWGGHRQDHVVGLNFAAAFGGPARRELPHHHSPAYLPQVHAQPALPPPRAQTHERMHPAVTKERREMSAGGAGLTQSIAAITPGTSSLSPA